jgi:hypothetical protein
MPIKEKLDKDLVNALTSLYIDHTWLADRSDEVIELFDFCKDGSEQELLIQLLKLFEFITPERYQECLNSICEKITARWGLKESETMLVSLSANEEADSGQLILYDLRTTLSHRHGWLQTKTVNTFGKAQKFAHTRPNVVLVDEFLGTGRSLVGRITEIRKQFNNKGIQTFNIYACIVAGMSFGLEKVKLETGIDPFSVKVCRKGISDLLPDDKRAEGRTLMTAMEDRLAQQYCGVALPRFGDGNGEALYGRQSGNCPNTVFPLFWWPRTSDEKVRKTLLSRNIGASD